MDFLDNTAYYMHKVTGSVATGEEINGDFTSAFNAQSIVDQDDNVISDIFHAWDIWAYDDDETQMLIEVEPTSPNYDDWVSV